MSKSAKQALIQLLSRRDYFTFELRDKLLKKGLSKEEIERALSEMETLGYLNDERLAQSYVRKQLALGYGPRAIEFKWRSKGGGEMMPYRPSFEEQEEALRMFVARKKLTFTDSVSKQKLFTKLSQKGFDLEVISKYFSNII